jgi:hypothetical protein
MMSISYSKLEYRHIRLLSFLDDTGHRCSLSSHDLLDAPPYIALSYTWGPAAYQKGRSPTQNYQAQVESSVISLQQNLHDALEHLGHHVRRRGCKIWIDFLCINQSDVSERNSQVRLMKEIYESATAIYGWLGLPFDNNEARLAVVLMRSFNTLLRNGLAAHENDINQVAKTINSSTQGWPAAVNTDSWSAWEGIADMFNQSYWQRTWIYQEATTPGEIWFFFGGHSYNDIHLSATVYIAHRFSLIKGFPSQFAKAAGDSSSAWALATARSERGKGKERKLLDLMSELKNCLCTDARDKVFAALGHATDVPAGCLSTDYTKELVDVYTDVVRFALEQENIGTSVFGAVFHPACDSKDAFLSAVLLPAMPSWVPDWRRRVKLGSLQGGKSMRESNEPLFDPCPGTSIEYRIDAQVLTLSGYVLDDIVDVTSIWDGPAEDLKIPRAWEKELELTGCDNEKLRFQDYQRALVADTRFTTTTGSDLRFSKSRGHTLDWALITAADDSMDVESYNLRNDALSQLVTTSYGRRMGVVANGNIGIFPPATTPGDKVVMFMGGKLLYVIRHAAKYGGYSLIGECYINGLMDGGEIQSTGTHHSIEHINLI